MQYMIHVSRFNRLQKNALLHLLFAVYAFHTCCLSCVFQLYLFFQFSLTAYKPIDIVDLVFIVDQQFYVVQFSKVIEGFGLCDHLLVKKTGRLRLFN